MGKQSLLSRLMILLFVTAGAAVLPLTTSHQAAHASAKTPGVRAYIWAYHHVGRPYCWGGAGPGCFDCSGLVMSAYEHAGLPLRRTTYAMLRSSRLVPESESRARRGDLAFYGSGHVEFFVRPGHTFGALDSGTLIGWHHWSRWWHPTMFFRVRGSR
ncbi:MAG TPA: NlpC/P60 family protein [Streptosporangiaceae bacterium]|nr:NlpC/P60 family protein [Streptosporangiaceae bacterium]